MEVKVVGEVVANHLKIVEAAAHGLAKTRVIGRPALSSWSALLDYCMAAMARSQNEEFRVVFLDRKNSLIADEVQNRGTIDHAPLYPCEIIKRALELGASSIILVHNHFLSHFRPRRETLKHFGTLGIFGLVQPWF